MKMSAPLVVLLLLAAVSCAVLAPVVVLGRIAPPGPVITPRPTARTAEVPGGTIRYEDTGEEGPVTVFLHGFNAELATWDGTWSRLDGCGRRIRLDIPGFGESIWNSASYVLPDQAERVLAFLDGLGVGRVTLVGTSMGGSLAAWIAAAHPERVERLALLAPSGYTGALRWPGLFGRLLGPGPLNRVATWIARTPLFTALYPRSKALQALSVTSSYGPAWVEALARIRVPTLILWSVGDDGVSYTTARAVQRAIGGSELLWLDRATGHMIPQERPDLVAATSCLLARGVAPEAVAAALPIGLLHPGEGAGDGAALRSAGAD